MTNNEPCSQPEPCALHPRRLPGRPWPEPTTTPAKLLPMKWEVTEERAEEKPGELHHFSFTSQLCAWLATTSARIARIELIQHEDVSDVVAFFGTPVVTHATFEGQSLTDLLVLLRR